ncbi:MAG: ATP-dependent Clp protease ATP-binding subunit, partial [Bacteroidetes bacterium]|nr:ATP-dependent Clp protease ATP-binding subunit [Bacteroidota bacterium]
MQAKFSPRLQDVISYAREEAIRLGHDFIGCEHLLLGLLRDGEGKAIKTLRSLDIDVVRLRKSVEESLKPLVSGRLNNLASIPVTKQAEKVLKITYLEARIFKTELIGTEHLMLSILRDEDNVASQLLNQFAINYEIFKAAIENNVTDSDENDGSHSMPPDIRAELPTDYPDDFGKQETPKSPSKPGEAKSKTPVLDNFGRDLTRIAEEGKLDAIVGREKEIERVSQILSRRKKNNPILIC